MSAVPPAETRPTKTLAEARAQWELEKLEFGRLALAQALVFMGHDNAIVGNFTTITTSLAQFAEAHPDRVFTDGGMGSGVVEAGPGDLAGSGVGSDILAIIKEVVVEDKKFFLGLIGKLFGLS